MRYTSYGQHLRKRFGHPVHKVSVDARFTCPNVDGTVATGGCTFCDNRSFSPSRRLPKQAIHDQLDEGIKILARRYPRVHRYLAYFQPATNTYAPVPRLRQVYEEALSHEAVVGLVIGTRVDCVPDEVLDLLEEIASRTYLSVEYGLQTIHDRSLEAMNRGHRYDAFLDAMQRSRGRGFEICAHVMLGLPGETHDCMMATAREVARLELDAVKIHNLYAVKNTPLGEQVERGEVTLMTRDEYLATLVDFVERLPPTVVVERISGDAPEDFFIGPAWSLEKASLRLAFEQELARRDTWQGKRWAEERAWLDQLHP